MKKILITTAALALAATIATPALAETAAAPLMDVTVITQDAAHFAGHDWLVPTIFIVMWIMMLGGGHFYGLS